MALDFKKLSILIVEDTEPMCKLIASVLESFGAGAVYTAENGEVGFEKFRKHNPDIVIADWHMDPVNGIALTKQIRTSVMSPNRMVPIILITGYSAIERVAEARDAGVTDVLVKPFSANDLAKRLARVINNPRDFIDCETYFGPDRRHKTNPGYKGPFRRETDKEK